MTFREHPCYLHKQKQNVAFELCDLGLLKKASLKMCQTEIGSACWQAAVNFRECRERSRWWFFSSSHTDRDGPQLQSLCVLKWSLYLREDERVRDVKRRGEWERQENEREIWPHCSPLHLLLFWCYWASDKCELLPIRPCQSQEMPLSQTANTRENDISQTWETAFFNSLALSPFIIIFFFSVSFYCVISFVFILACLLVPCCLCSFSFLLCPVVY